MAATQYHPILLAGTAWQPCHFPDAGSRKLLTQGLHLLLDWKKISQPSSFGTQENTCDAAQNEVEVKMAANTRLCAYYLILTHSNALSFASEGRQDTAASCHRLERLSIRRRGFELNAQVTLTGWVMKSEPLRLLTAC